MSKDRKKVDSPSVRSTSTVSSCSTSPKTARSHQTVSSESSDKWMTPDGGSPISLPPPSNDGTVDLDAPFPLENQEEAAEIYRNLWNKRNIERRDFRESNLSVEYATFEKLVKDKKLDSNLKKCTAFVRKMKQFVESQKASILADLDTLNLTKYQSEIAAMVVDGRIRLGEIPAMVAVCSEIHKRYSEFSGHLLENFKRTLPTKKTEVTPAVISKLSSDLRFYSELLLGGILPDQEGYSLFVNSLKNMVFLDKEGMQFLVVFASLLKGLTDDLIGVIPEDNRLTLEETDVLSELIRSEALSAARKREVQSIFEEYFEITANNVVKKHEELLKSEKYNRKLLTTKGEIPSDRQEAHAELSIRFEKFLYNATKLSFLLDIPMPVLRELPPDPEDDLEKALLTTEDGEVLTEVPGIVLFDNEETRQFYQDYPDLKVYLPPVVYRDNILQMQEKTKKLEESEKMVDEFDADLEQAELQEDKDDVVDEAVEAEGDLPPSMRLENEDEKENVESKDAGPVLPHRQAFLNFLDTLPNCVNKNMIDKAGIDFAEHHNNKRHRRDLVRRLFLVPRQRTDLVPLYSRLVAILSRVFPDVGIDLSSMLQKDFRYLVLKKDQIKIETKLKITRFIGELVNFSVFPKSEAFNCLKMLLRNFTHHQVEMACAFVETCGRFLYRSSDSHRRMKIYLEEMLRKKTVKNLETRYVYMLDSAYYHICPPAGGSTHRKKKPFLQSFMESILWEDLNKSTLERALNVLKMYDWNDEQKFRLVIKILGSPWKFSYVQMESASALLVSIKQFRPDVTSAVIENLTEYIRVLCDYEFDDLNNHRIATAQYLAYIYTYKGFSTTTLFNIWYYLISYGVTYQNDSCSRMDAPDNLYRIRMICQMLRICGDYLTSTKSKRRLNFYLKYFQRYCVYKRNLPYWEYNDFPHSVEELYEDTLKKLRGRWKWAKTMEEAEKDIADIDEKLRDKNAGGDMKTVMASQKNYVRLPGSSSRARGRKSRSRPTNGANLKYLDLNRITEEPEDDSVASNDNSQTDDIYEQFENESEEKSKKANDGVDDFDAAYEQMMQDFNPSTKNVKVELPLPISASSTEASAGGGMVNITLLTKKNNKQKMKLLSVPADEKFILHMKSLEQVHMEEKQKMKNRTLAITRLQEEEERREEEESVSQLVFGKFNLKR